MQKANMHSGFKKIWERRPYPPLVMSIVAQATVDGFSKLSPSKITLAGNFWVLEENTYFFIKREIDETVSNLINEALQQPSYILQLFKQSYRHASHVSEYSKKYLGGNLSKISISALLSFHQEFMKKFTEAYSYGTAQILIGYSDDNPIYKKAAEIIASKIKNSGKNFSDYFIALSAIPQKLETDYQNLAVLLVAKKAKRLGLKKKKQILLRLKKDLLQLVYAYSYISYDLKNNISWDTLHYAAQVHDKLTTDIEGEIKKINQYEENAEKKFRHAVRQLKLDRKELVVFEILRQLGYYKWAREHAFLYGLYNIKPVQDEIARRCGISGIDFRFLLPDEVGRMVRDPKKYAHMIRERKKRFFLLIHPHNIVERLAGTSAEEQISHIAFVPKKGGEENHNVLNGTPVCHGKVKGKVTIVNVVKHVGKMVDGNILVSIATTPDLLPAMKKSKAIVTDEGGVTCHAAIVARELKIPCIVGTKHATKVLSDGDEVEVDADIGIITVLKRITTG